MKVSRMNSGVSRRNQGENQIINDNVRDALDVDLAMRMVRKVYADHSEDY